MITDRTYISVDEVRNRSGRLLNEEGIPKNLPLDYEYVLKSIKDKNIDESSIVENYIKSYSDYNNCNSEWLSLFYFTESVRAISDKYYRKAINTISENVIPNSSNLPNIKDAISKLIIPDEDKSMLEQRINVMETCDRLIHNYNMIGNRFNLEEFTKGLELAADISSVDINPIAEQFCGLIDTYNMPLRKKVATCLETGIYINEMHGDTKRNRELVTSIVEYFIGENPAISDRDYKSIVNTLESNPFISNSDILGVNYLLEADGNTFKNKLESLANASKGEVKSTIIKIANCKVVSAVKGIIKAVIGLILSSFVLAGTIAFTEVMILIAAVFGLLLTIAASPSVVISCIRKEIEKSEENIKKANNPEITKRYNKVYVYVRDTTNSVENSKDQTAKAAALLDEALETAGVPEDMETKEEDTNTLEEEYAFLGSINDICNKGLSVTNESENYADSNDVKDLIKRYKADQDKSMPKLKKIITRAFSKNPKAIIDELPDILELIRFCCIGSTLAIPAIGPGVALVTFVAERFITITIKREETDRVIKYFKKEKTKVENKLSNTKNQDKKEDLEKYSKCLDKCIDKLEDYRDKLYSEKELDARYDIDEATISNSVSERISLDQLFNGGLMSQLSKAVSRASQIIKNELIRNNLTKFVYNEYEINQVPIAKYLNDIGQQEFIAYYITPGGMIDIPIGKIYAVELEPNPKPKLTQSQELYMLSIDICDMINNYIEWGFIATSYLLDNKIVFTLNYIRCVETNPIKMEMESSITESALNLIAQAEFGADWVEDMGVLESDSIVDDLIEHIDIIIDDDTIDEIAETLVDACLDYSKFCDYLKDYQYSFDDTCHPCCSAEKLDDAIYTLQDRIDKGECEQSSFQSIYQLEATEILREVVNEAKDIKKSGKKQNKGSKEILKNAKKKVSTNPKPKKTKKSSKGKGKDLKSMVDDVGKKASKTVDNIKKDIDKKAKERVPLGTTVKLAGKAVATKVKDLSNKEKEISRTIDAYSDTIIKKTKDAMVSNKRESIIKGSVVPSFSKMIKSAAALGVVGAVTNPVVAAIGAVGGLATSKYLTEKERKILLEEIEVELKVVEEQIDKYKDNPAKYRQLLTYQRKLQRESQRIRYGIKIKGKDVPNPEM